MATTTTHYKIHIHKTDTYLKLTYRGNSFSKLERLKGKITDSMLMELGRIIPPRLSEMEKWQNHFKDKISLEALVKKKSHFSEFNDAWFQFYEDFTGIPPKFGATEASHLKKIITHLTKVGGSPDEALSLWNTILAAWPKLSDFHKDNTDIKYINSRLNVILNAVKKAINTGTSTTSGTDNSASL
jgi:hypothetical protein